MDAGHHQVLCVGGDQLMVLPRGGNVVAVFAAVHMSKWMIGPPCGSKHKRGAQCVLVTRVPITPRPPFGLIRKPERMKTAEGQNGFREQLHLSRDAIWCGPVVIIKMTNRFARGHAGELISFPPDA